MIDPTAVKITELAGVKGLPAEPIFRRAAVLTVKGYENYLRMGRRIKPDEIPLKFIKSRNVTINKKRAAEALAAEGLAPVEQPLYSWEQTELYVADPIVDVRISLALRGKLLTRGARRVLFRRMNSGISIFTFRQCCQLEALTSPVRPLLLAPRFLTDSCHSERSCHLREETWNRLRGSCRTYFLLRAEERYR